MVRKLPSESFIDGLNLKDNPLYFSVFLHFLQKIPIFYLKLTNSINISLSIYCHVYKHLFVKKHEVLLLPQVWIYLHLPSINQKY